MKKLLFALFAVFLTIPSYAQNSLFYFEAQALGGYSSLENKAVYHSGHSGDAMQNNSVGFDFIKKFSRGNSDFLTAALQLRLSYDDNENKAVLYPFNAYIKIKTRFTDFWLGHNRAAFGLESYWDTHADLLKPLQMYDFGYDRDWGIGLSKDLPDGNISFAFTSGSGMALKFYGNYLATARFSKGVLNYDNYSAGASLMAGKTLETMGYAIMNKKPAETFLASADFAYNYTRFEHKIQLDAGKKDYENAFAGFYRLSVNFFDENKLKLEGQYVYALLRAAKQDYISAGLTYRLSGDLTARAMYELSAKTGDYKTIFQLYYYGII